MLGLPNGGLLAGFELSALVNALSPGRCDKNSENLLSASQHAGVTPSASARSGQITAEPSVLAAGRMTTRESALRFARCTLARDQRPMTDVPSEVLLERLAAGGESAADEVFTRYFER